MTRTAKIEMNGIRVYDGDGNTAYSTSSQQRCIQSEAVSNNPSNVACGEHDVFLLHVEDSRDGELQRHSVTT